FFHCAHTHLQPHLPSTLFFLNDTAHAEIYTLSLHDALPICVIQFAKRLVQGGGPGVKENASGAGSPDPLELSAAQAQLVSASARSEEHTSELQSRENLVCRLLLEKKNKKKKH